jgi:RHS repeat-associated protein
VENRVISVSGGASFVYDGDGNRVKKTENGETILYVNQFYEKNLTTGVVTTYYYLDGKLVAMREGTDLKYTHQDHLTSTSVMTDSSGDSLGAIKYLPFGECRNSPPYPTDILFTGQRLDSTGLYYYNARYYDPTIGRFISADTIVSHPANPQSFNRYTYCLNNPMKYTDPSGHVVVFNERKIRTVRFKLPFFTIYKEYVLFDFFLAWDKFKEVAPNVAQAMEASERVYSFSWLPVGGQGSGCFGTGGGDQTIWMDNNLQGSSSELIAVIMAHESVHARQGELHDTVYEEVVAYQYEYMIGKQLGITTDLSAKLKDINLGLTGDALIDELMKAKAVLEATGNIVYQNISLGGPGDIFPLDVGGGFDMWGYTSWGTPIYGMTDPRITNPDWWEEVTGG